MSAVRNIVSNIIYMRRAQAFLSSDFCSVDIERSNSCALKKKLNDFIFRIRKLDSPFEPCPAFKFVSIRKKPGFTLGIIFAFAGVSGSVMLSVKARRPPLQSLSRVSCQLPLISNFFIIILSFPTS